MISFENKQQKFNKSMQLIRNKYFKQISANFTEILTIWSQNLEKFNLLKKELVEV